MSGTDPQDAAAVSLRCQHAAEVLKSAATGVTAGPWEVTDCEGELALRAGSALPTWFENWLGYSLPPGYRPEHVIAEHDLDTWDEGEDSQDDELRANVQWAALVDPRIAEPLAALLSNIAYYGDELAGSWRYAAAMLADVVLENEDRDRARNAAMAER